jgi:hypothetical protein
MFNYTSHNQLDIFAFKTEFESKLNPENRWVKMSKILDWDAFASIYAENLSSTMGAKSIDARVVIGALIIKHIERKDDRGTIEMIQENPYMQYFLGLDQFSLEPVFDPSLFVHIRKRLGNDSFDKMNQLIIEKALKIENKTIDKLDEKTGNDDDDLGAESGSQNSGKLQMDATIADAYIKFPTDLNLLNDGREQSEMLLDLLCKELQLKKPRNYRQKARKLWLNLSKKKRKGHQQIRKGIRQQLGFLNRNIKNIDKILDKNPQALQVLKKQEYKYLLVIRELHRQQEEMYSQKTNSIPNRIVSIHQPHIRPMVRGKQGRNVEFGAKINVSLQDGYARIDQLNFESFNEGIYLQQQVENYKKLHGHYPELVQTDDIYMNRENRAYLKEHGIRHTGRPLGRKPKMELSLAQKKVAQIEKNERNHIEGKFGQGKSKYNLNKIMAKLQDTAQSWISAIFFVMNILKLCTVSCALILKAFILNIFVVQIVLKNELKLLPLNSQTWWV